MTSPLAGAVRRRLRRRLQEQALSAAESCAKTLPQAPPFWLAHAEVTQ